MLTTKYSTKGHSLDLVSLIGQPVTIKELDIPGVVVAVRIDHNRVVHVEGKWASFGLIDRYWKPLKDVHIDDTESTGGGENADH